MKIQTAKTRPAKPVAKSTTAVRGKYFNQLPEGTNLAIIDPALHTHFPDSESVNKALRAFLDIGNTVHSATPPRRRPRSARPPALDPRTETAELVANAR